MTDYFKPEKSIEKISNGDILKTLSAVSSRYMNVNPEEPFTVRPFSLYDISRNPDYRYTADCSKLFPDAEDGSYVYFCGRYFARSSGAIKFLFIPFGPVKIYMNNKAVYGTTFEDERYENKPITIDIPVRAGYNSLCVRCTKTRAGFGAEFGTWLGKLDYYFLHEREGLRDIEGFDYTYPQKNALKKLPAKTSLFVPFASWDEKQQRSGVLNRIFGRLLHDPVNKTFVARTVFVSPKTDSGSQKYAFLIDVSPSLQAEVYVDGVKLCDVGPDKAELGGGKTCEHGVPEPKSESEKKAGVELCGFRRVKKEISCGEGIHNILLILKVLSLKHEADFSVTVKNSNGRGVHLLNPLITQNPERFPWMFAGPFKKTSPAQLLDGGFNRYALVGADGEKTYWRIDMPGGWLRLYNDAPLFAHWNYPLGVTLYGLTETARHFKSAGLPQKISSYVKAHILRSLKTFDYALFDKKQFTGATAVHHLLTSIDSLDDCGSFASTMLGICTDAKLWDGEGASQPHGGSASESLESSESSENFRSVENLYKRVAEYAGDYIIKKQSRLPDGTFFRKRMMHAFHNGTMWADDLYMSVPFLCRYSVLKNDEKILTDAAMQFLGFKKFLFMPENSLMAHVYDFGRKMNTGIPWGRGNGWTIFSLSEILRFLPDPHPLKKELTAFFRELAAGILKQQNEDGMWRQVLDMPESYRETSCTAMFICAYSRGIRNGWLTENVEEYKKSCIKAWRAIERFSIDAEGNVYGVCRGSEFAFTPRYYAEHLLPRLNDTHGIGIALLAGVEMERLFKYCGR
ncbi:glycoside hydrolase family 88/105 protein [Treponema parvum]|uniref:glycoside hydrolase family 88/105 protein n=1 Tax=Treponema parvum TaxID=138851 RepID=UPI001AEC700A|nr:glycoside hydrolase family 88 protein [Treponema parvum]QTQ15541.1 glycoside hydrolase family 88 protein [Treponema parvum]